MYKIGVFGSGETEGEEVMEMARAIGRKLAAQGCIVVTGACSGVPYAAAHAAAKAGAEVWGFSPTASDEEQREFTPDDDLSIYSVLHLVPPTFSFNADLLVCKKYRNVLSTAHCDGGIIIAGKWGTLNELTNLLDYGKAAGVLAGSGGIADELAGLVERVDPKAADRVVIERTPELLVERLLATLDRRAITG